jgi:hypothetical protein
MQTTSYPIVGGGLTADGAWRGIREHDPGGSVLVVGEEPHPPYLRPPRGVRLWNRFGRLDAARELIGAGEQRLGHGVVV